MLNQALKWAEVKSVKRAKIAELFFYPESEKWFKARVNLLWIDEVGKEKKVGVIALVQSDNMKDARERIEGTHERGHG